MGNAKENELDYPAGDAIPAPGSTIDIAPGIRWLRMGLPFALDHINLWLLRDGDGWTIVDCGIGNDATRAHWEQVFAERLDGLPVRRVIATHMHPDHIGLSHWLTERWDCRLWVSATDYQTARVARSSTIGYGGDRAAEHFASHGLTDPAAVAKVRARSNYYATLVPALPESFHRLMDGMTIAIGERRWRCIAGYGHAPEHISLYSDSGVLISGDMLLPRISTNVSVMDVEPEANPLALYLDSTRAIAELPDDTLVLPSHGRPFVGLRRRARQLIEHHDERYAEVLEACAAAPQSAAELLPVLFKRPLDLHQTTFAMGEAIAHLHALWYEGKLARQRDAAGVWRFTRCASAA